MSQPVFINELPVATNMTNADLLPIWQNGQTKQATPDLLPFVQSGTGALTSTLQTALRLFVHTSQYTSGNYTPAVAALTGTFGVNNLIAAGPAHAIGVSETKGWVGLRINMTLASSGASDIALGVDCAPSITLATGDTNYAAKMGIAGGTITTQGQSQTIGHVAALRVGDPIIVVGAGDTISVAATVYIVDAPTEGVINAALYIADGSEILGNGDLTITKLGSNAYLNLTTASDSSGVVRFNTNSVIRSTLLGDSAAPFRFFAGDSATLLATFASGGATFTGTLTADGVINTNSDTDSTSTTTGALQTDGGLGVVKALLVGGLANIAGAFTASGTGIFANGDLTLKGFGGTADSGLLRLSNAGTTYIFYNATSVFHRVSGTDRLTLTTSGASITGTCTVSSLAGAGTRTVVVDANGVMSAP